MLPVAAGSCAWVGTGMGLPSAPRASGAAAITYKAQHWAGKVSSLRQTLLLKLISYLLKMQRNSLLPLEHLPLLECCPGLEPLISPPLSLGL